ncbi:MAG: hypothetical protein ACT4PE_04900 [Candidatus Eiseniibacteriota bacterium]
MGGHPSLRMLERQLKITEAQIKLARLNQQLREELREGQPDEKRPDLIARGRLPAPPTAGLPVPPPPTAGLPPLSTPPLAQPPVAQASAPPAPPKVEPVKDWPRVRAVARGRGHQFAIVQHGSVVRQVAYKERFANFIVEEISHDGVQFVHEPTHQAQFVTLSTLDLK